MKIRCMKLCSLLLALALILCLPAAALAGGEQAEDAFPVTVTDQLGREVTVESEPETVVSGYYISTSLLLALGQGDKLAGVEAKADTRPIYALAAPEVIDLPGVGTAKQFDLETCAALEPDLVVLPAKLKDAIPALEELGLTVVAVDPEDRAKLEQAAVLLGTVTGSGERAQALLQFSDGHLAALAEALEGVETPSVYLASNSALLACAGPAMYQNDIIIQAGGVNAAAEIDADYWADVSYEQLLAWDPDYIVLAADADYTAQSVLEDPALTDLTAVKAGRVYQFPSAIEAWDSPVPGAVLGSLWLASALHPDRVAAGDWQGAVTDFYDSFYGFTPEPDTLG